MSDPRACPRTSVCRTRRGFCRPVADARAQPRLHPAVRPPRGAQAAEGRGAAQARALFLGVRKRLLGGPAEEPRGAPTGWSASSAIRCWFRPGPARSSARSSASPISAFDERWLKALTASPPRDLSIVRVEGNSMAPTLNAGRRHPGRPRRLRASGCATAFTCCGSTMRWWSSGSRSIRAGGGVTIQSDNPAYPDWPDCELDEIKLHRPRDLVRDGKIV